jgi:hypothetical protein
MTTIALGHVGSPVGNRRGTLIAAGAGLLYPVLGIASAVLTDELDLPSWTSPRSSIADYYAGVGFDSLFTIGMALGAAAFLLWLLFVAKIADLVGTVDGGSSWVRSSIVAFAVVDVVLVLCFLATTVAAVFWGSHGGLSADGYLTLHGLALAFYWLALPAVALGDATIGVAIVAGSVFPRWLGWAAIAIAVANGVGFFLPVEAWTVVSGLPFLWTLAVAILLFVRADRYSEPVVDR